MHDSQVVDLLIYSIHVKKKAEVGDSWAHIDGAKLIATAKF